VQAWRGRALERGLAITSTFTPSPVVWKGKFYPYDDVNQKGDSLT